MEDAIVEDLPEKVTFELRDEGEKAPVLRKIGEFQAEKIANVSENVLRVEERSMWLVWSDG